MTDELLMQIWCPWCREYVAPHDEAGVAEANQHTHQHADVAPTATEVEQTYVLAPKFEVGDAVRDVGQPPVERGTMRVIEVLNENADEVAIDGLDGKTVDDVNPEHPRRAPVYRCVFEGWLKSNVPDWEDFLHEPESLGVHVQAFCREWNVSLRSYDYPATRLGPRPTCPECDERLEWVDHKSAYLCPNTKYIHPDPTCDQTTPIAAHGQMGGEYDPYSHGDPKVLASGVEILGDGACPVCDGQGEIDAVPEPMTCPHCEGSGFASDDE